MGALGRGGGQFVAEHAAHAAAPGRVGQQVDGARRQHVQGTELPRHFHVVSPALADPAHHRLGADERERIGVAMQDRVQVRRPDEQIVFAVPIGVVVEALAQFAQPADLIVGQTQRGGQPPRLWAEIVAEGRDDRPDAVPPGQMAVHDQAGARAGAGVDEGAQGGVPGNVAGVVMVEVLDPHAAREQAQQRGAIRVERNVERGHRVAGPRGDTLEQADITLDARDQSRRARRGQAQLVQRAEAVGIAVEHVEMSGRAHAGNVDCKGGRLGIIPSWSRTRRCCSRSREAAISPAT
ncbi:MAG: hypothetical protein IPI73_22740 [Betaproteobacteria bacterium]|nr:hypothetical protein [Betaproteobacteria bacterium]